MFKVGDRIEVTMYFYDYSGKPVPMYRYDIIGIDEIKELYTIKCVPNYEFSVTSFDLRTFCRPVNTSSGLSAWMPPGYNTTGLNSTWGSPRKSWSYTANIPCLDLGPSAKLNNCGFDDDGKIQSLKKCECGSSSVNSPFHSSWCPLHDK